MPRKLDGKEKGQDYLIHDENLMLATELFLLGDSMKETLTNVVLNPV